MKRIYSVNNSKDVLGTLEGLKSRISSLNSRIWTVIAPMLFVAFGLLGVNENAWAGKVKLQLYSSPAEGGYVYANTEDKNNIGTKTSDDATSGYKVGGSVTMYRFAKAATGYEFMGWADSDRGTPSSTASSISLGAKVGTGTKEYTYWAIFYALPKYYFKATATTNSSTYGNAYVTFTSSAANSTTDTEVTTNCYGAHYNSTSATKTAYFRAVAKSGYVFKGWSTDTTEAHIFNTATSITVDLESDSKSSASPDEVHRYAIFGEKFAPQINGTASENKEVGDSYTADFSFVNTSLTTPSSSSTADFYYTITHELSTSVNNGTNVISYNPSTGAIQALNAGKATITFINNSTATHQYKEESFVINVAKKEPTFSCGTSMNVGQNLSCTYTNTSANTPTANSSDNFYYVFTNNTPSGITTGSDTPGAILTFSGNKVYGKNAGTGTITFYQKETYMYKPKNSGAINITVTKNNNELSCSWGNWIKNVNFDSHTAVTFTSTNTEAGAPAVTISKVSGGAVADYNSSTKKIDANHRDGTVIWEIEQVENYKYIRAFEKCTVNVGTVSAPDCEVTLYSAAPDATATSVGLIDLGGVGVKLYFQMKMNFLGAIVKVSTSADGNDWTSTNKSSGATKYSDGNQEMDLPANTRYIRFEEGPASSNPYINNIRVMRTKYFDIENKAGSTITEMTMPLNIHGGVVKRDTFYVDYSTCEGTIKLENHHPRIKFAATNSNTYSFSTGTAHYGRPAIALTYTSPANDAENITDTIYIYTPSDHKKLIVHAQSKGKLQTTLHYIGKASYSADTTNIASMALFEVRDENNDLVANPIITLGTGTTSNVTLANDNKSIASLCGNSNDGTTGNVTASYAGDGTYEAATNNGLSQNFTINRLKDEVSFDSGYESMVVGEEIDLTEWATSCTSGSDITVTSVFKDYIVIEDGKVKAVAKGNGRLRAASAGDCTYNSGVKFLNIAVRNPEDPCESSLLYSSKLIKVGAYEHTSSSPVTYVIPDGPQDKLTFKVWRVPAATQYATLEILDKNDNVLTNGTFEYTASSLPSSEPDAPNKEINMADYPGAKKLRFYGWGTLNKYFSEVRISQKAYLTASTSSVTMSTVQACDTAKGQFTVDYSDVSHIQLSQTNNDFSYEVWDGETKLIGFENGCKSYGTYTVKFFYVPQAKGGYSNTVTLSASGKEQVITLSGTANKPDRTIVWDIPTGNTITATQSVNLTAYAKTDCEDPAGSVTYSYTSAVAGAATIEGSKITFNKAATVTVKAETVTSDMYEDATYVEKVWTVGKVGTQMRTLPTITSTITYGDNSSVVTYDNDSWKAEEVLNNTEVKGHINYVGPASFTAAGPQNLIFNFTPDSIATYDVCQFTVPVTVNKLATLNVPVALSFCAGESETFHGETFDTAGEYDVPAEGATRDTVYKVTVTVLQPTTGTDSKTITYGDNESWNGIDLSGYAAGSHEVEYHTTNAVGCDSTVTLTLTVNALINEFTNNAGDGDWNNPDNWTSVPEGENPDVIVSGDLEIDGDITVGNLTIENTGSITVITNGTLTVNGTSESRTEYGDIHVMDDGALALGNSADLQVRHFTLDAKLGDADNAAASGQVSNEEKMNINGDVYFQLSFDPNGAIDYGWYDFTVPFPVDINGGIERVNSTSDKEMVCGQDFLLMEDDEVSFVNGGKGWRQISSGVLEPGKLYTITFDETVNQNTFRFAWNGHGDLTNGESFAAQYLTGSDASRNGWNAVGNAMLRHGHIDGDYKIQAYNHTDNTYELIYGDKTFAVGTAFFVQVEAAGDIDWTPAEATVARPLYAPKRTAENVEEFRLGLRDEATGAIKDALFFSASEEATAAYVIGHDLLKRGTPTQAKKAQMWATKGGKNLCDVEATLIDDNASAPLFFYAPQAGTYELTIDAAPVDATLYLTYNDAIIWDLTASPYILDLTKGTTNGYGLRMEARRGPQVTTDIETVNGEKGARKVLIDNVLYIVTPEGRMYDIVGKGIKY